MIVALMLKHLAAVPPIKRMSDASTKHSHARAKPRVVDIKQLRLIYSDIMHAGNPKVNAAAAACYQDGRCVPFEGWD